jgi:heme/copper-type cytochrome/quinol oxidase subunit 2
MEVCTTRQSFPANMKFNKAWVVMFCITVLGFFAGSKASYSLWMTAHPLYQSEEWSRWFYFWFILTVVLAICWLICAFYLWKNRRHARPGH